MLEIPTDTQLIAEDDPKLLGTANDWGVHVAPVEPELLLARNSWKTLREWEKDRLEKLEDSSSPTTRYARANMNDVKSGSNTGAQEIFQSIYNGRKSWKTLRGGEMVWPAELEAALIEGTQLL